MKYFKLKNTKHTQEIKAKFILPFCFVFWILAMFYTYIYYTNWHAVILSSICFTGGFLALLIGFLNKKFKFYYTAANLATLLFFVIMTIMSIYGGGAKSNSIWWLGTIPLVATFLLNSSFGIIWFALVFIDFFIILSLGNNSMLPASMLNTNTQGRFVLSFFMNSTLIFALCSLSDLIGDAAREEREELKMKAFQLKQVSTLGKLAAGVAHEINNPLTIVKAYKNKILKMLQGNEPLDREEIEKFLEKIETNTQRIQIVTTLMNTISEQEKNRELTEFDLIGLIQEVLRMLGKDVDQHAVTIDLQSHNHAFPFRGLYSEIFQAFFNIFETTIHELSKVKGPRKLTIKLHEEKNKYYCSIETVRLSLIEGPVEDFFIPFSISDYSNMSKGLGLSFSFNVFRSNGGDIEVAENSKLRTILKICLPRQS
jgi:signal transduction histidine kinase